MVGAFSKALRQLTDPTFRRVFWRGILGALLALIAAYFATDYGLGLLADFDLPWGDDIFDAVVDWAALPILLVASYFLFPGIATGVMSIFLDDVVDAVEKRHYSAAPAARHISFGRAAWMGAKMGAVVVLWNLVALPLYIVLFFTAIGPLFLFIAINGYLLGREYIEMVALRHLSEKEARMFRQVNRSRVFSLGVLTSLLFMVPIVNLFAPLLGAAMAVHLFHRRTELASAAS